MTYSFSHIAVVIGFCYFSFWSFRVSIRNTDCIIWWHAPLVFLQFFTVAVLKSVNTKPSFSIWVSWARSFFMLGCPAYQRHNLSQLLVFYLKCTVGLPLLAFCRLSIFLIHQLPPTHFLLCISACYYLFCGIGLQLTMVPVRPDVAYTRLITSLASMKNGSLLCVSTEICHLCLPLRNTSTSQWELNECECI